MAQTKVVQVLLRRTVASLFEHQGGGAAHKAARAGGQHDHRLRRLGAPGGRARLLRCRHVQRHVRVLRGWYVMSVDNGPRGSNGGALTLEVVSAASCQRAASDSGNDTCGTTTRDAICVPAAPSIQAPRTRCRHQLSRETEVGWLQNALQVGGGRPAAARGFAQQPAKP